jgi:hypothetical protein
VGSDSNLGFDMVFVDNDCVTKPATVYVDGSRINHVLWVWSLFKNGPGLVKYYMVDDAGRFVWKDRTTSTHALDWLRTKIKFGMSIEVYR